MKIPIKKEIPSLEVVIGDVPVYTFKVRLCFNTTGNKAYTQIFDIKNTFVMDLTDTTNINIIVDKIKKVGDKDVLHKHFYHDWVSSQEKHPLRGTVASKKYEI